MIISTCHRAVCVLFFFFNDTATTEIYTLSLHDALPISFTTQPPAGAWANAAISPALQVTVVDESGDLVPGGSVRLALGDRKSTRLNSSHSQISYAVFCLKKKKSRSDPASMTLSTVYLVI